MGICNIASNIAKWHYAKYYKRSNYNECDHSLGFNPVLDIQDEVAVLRIAAKDDRRTTSEASLNEKLLDLDKCQEVVRYLRKCCAETRKYKYSKSSSTTTAKRPVNTIIDAWQKYLLIAILTYTPVRQKEIRELEIGKMLKREPDGWWVTLTQEQHKTGRTTHRGREYPLFPGDMKEQLTKDLDTYIEAWRSKANLNHDFLFFRMGSKKYKDARGRPITTPSVFAAMVPYVMTRVTSILFGVDNIKSPTPHDFRRIFCTWLYTYGTGEEQEIYAEVMGHSVQEARKTYAKVPNRARTEGAGDAFKKVANRAKKSKEQKSKAGKTKSLKVIDKVAAIKALLQEVTLEERQALMQDLNQDS